MDTPGDISSQTETAERSTDGGAADSYGYRLHADVHRAVGGLLNLLREFARVSAALAPDVSAEWIIKRVLFFCYEFESLLSPSDDEAARLTKLNRFFFEESRFQVLAETSVSSRAEDDLLLGRAFTTRKVPALLLTVLYAVLAKRAGVDLEFVNLPSAPLTAMPQPQSSCRTKYFLKWNGRHDKSGRARFIDVLRAGRVLTCDELIETLQIHWQTEGDMATALERVPFESMISEYVSQIRSRLAPSADFAQIAKFAKLLYLQNILISYQPSNLQLLGERAILHRRLGNFRSAMTDLKRFFAFIDQEKAPMEFLQLRDELTKLLESDRSLT